MVTFTSDHLIVILTVFLLDFQENQTTVDGVKIFLQPIPLPSSETRRTQHGSVQFQVQNVADNTYHFGYDIDNEDTKSFREERRDAFGRVSGRYGYVEDGVLRIVEYEADSQGFRSRSIGSRDTEDNPLFVDHSQLPFIGPIPKPTT